MALLIQVAATLSTQQIEQTCNLNNCHYADVLPLLATGHSASLHWVDLFLISVCLQVQCLCLCSSVNDIVASSLTIE